MAKIDWEASRKKLMARTGAAPAQTRQTEQRDAPRQTERQTTGTRIDWEATRQRYGIPTAAQSRQLLARAAENQQALRERQLDIYGGGHGRVGPEAQGVPPQLQQTIQGERGRVGPELLGIPRQLQYAMEGSRGGAVVPTPSRGGAGRMFGGFGSAEAKRAAEYTALEDEIAKGRNDLAGLRPDDIEDAAQYSQYRTLQSEIEDLENRRKSMERETPALKGESALDRFDRTVQDAVYAVFSFDPFQPLSDWDREMQTRMETGGKAENGKNASIGDIIGGAIVTGMADFNKQVASGLDFLLPTDFLGEYDPFSALNELTTENQASLRARQEYALEDRSQAAKIASEVGSGTVAALPQAITALLSLPAAGIQSTAALAPQASGLASTFSQGVRAIAQNPGYWQSFITTVGGEYEDAKAQGGEGWNAAFAAIVSAMLNSVVEVGGGIQTLPGNLRNPGTSALLEWFKSGLDEGKEEVIQSLISGAMQKAMVDNQKPVFSLSDENAIVNPLSLAEDFGMGAAVGWTLGGGEALLTGALNRQARRENARAENAAQVALDTEPVIEAQDSTAAARDAAAQELVREAAPETHGQEAALLEKHADVFGESGRKAMRASYTPGQNAEAFYAGFAAQYQAGLTGRDAAKAQTGNLNQAQQYAAYTAGQNDARASLEAERQAAQFAPVAGKDSGLVYDSFVKGAVESGRTIADRKGNERVYLTADMARQVNDVAKALGVRVKFVDSVAGGEANADIRGADILIEKDNPNPVQYLAGHEFTHRIQDLAPNEYRDLRNYVGGLEDTGAKIDNLMDLYRRRGRDLSYEQALDEVTANYAGELFENSQTVDQFIRDNYGNKGLLQRVRDFLRKIVDKLTGRQKVQATEAEQKLTVALKSAADAVQANEQQNAAQEGRTTRYSINEQFSRDIQEWDKEGKPSGERFILGSTGPVLQGLGAIESDIYMNGDKINTILEKHPEMTIREIQSIPEILEDPVLVMKSRNMGRGGRQNTRLVMFGSVKAQDGRPIMCVLDLRPMERGFVVNDMQKVTSAYTKDSNPVRYLQNSEILHADKKRTIPLLRTIGFHMPIELQRSGSLGSISYNKQNVNLIGEKFSDVVHMGEGAADIRYSLKGEEELLSETKKLVKQAKKEGWSDAQLREALHGAVDRVIQSHVEKYGAIKPGEKPARAASVPRRTPENEKAPQTVRTILEKYADAFGASGRRAMRAAYTPGQNAGAFCAGFAAQYQAGLTGRDSRNARTGNLSRAQQYAAYTAGQNDARASLEAERQAARTRAANPGLVRNEQAGVLPKAQADFLDRLAREAGVHIELTESIADEAGNPASANGVYLPESSTVRIAMDADQPLMTVAAHEITHYLQDAAPEDYRAYRDYANRALSGRLGTAAVEEAMRRYAAHGQTLTMEQAMDEVAAEFAAAMVQDGKLFENLARENRSAARRVLDAVRAFLEKVRRVFSGSRAAQDSEAWRVYGVDMDTLEQAAKLWQSAYDAAGKAQGSENAAALGSEQYALNKRFSDAYDQWIQNYPEKAVSLHVGTTSEALKSIGVPDSPITWDTGKIRRIKSDHPGMTDSVLKQVPEIIENPILIMQSKSSDSRLTIFGTVMDLNGTPVLAVLELRPQNRRGVELGELKIASAYGKDSAQNLINSSDILYVEPNKKRTDSWLRDNRLQLPFSSANYGSIRSISPSGKNVNMQSDAARGARYSINEQFSQDIQAWNEEGQPAGERFILGSTGPVLQGLGAIESDIYMNGDKISAILEKHPEMTIREIQRIPEILEDPVLVLKSKNPAKSQYGNSRLVMFGSVKAQDGLPVMCVLDLRPTQNGFLLDDMQKVTSAYTKDTNPVSFIQRSEILHADTKRTIPLLRDVGFTRPASLLRNGSMGSISYNKQNVNLIGEKFSDVVSTKVQAAKAAGGEARYSIRQTEDGKRYVQADRQVIFGNDPDAWGQQVEDYINGKIRRGQDVQLIAADGDVLTLTADTAGKAKHAFLPNGKPMTDSQYWTKVNAEAHIDELAQVSRRDRVKPDVGKRHGEFAKNGWQYRTAYFQDFDGQYYIVDISVAQGLNGNVVYNIGDIRRRNLPNITGSSAKGGALKDGKTSPATSISKNGSEVNTQFGAAGGEARCSIKYDRDNTPYVVVDEDILDSVPRGEWIKTVKDNLRAKFPSGITLGRNEVNIDRIKKSGAEFTGQPHEAGRTVDSSTPTQSAAPASDGVSIQHGSEEVNGKFSRKEKSGAMAEDLRALQKENERLRERVEYFKGQTRRTKQITTDRERVARAARQLAKDCGADVDTKALDGEKIDSALKSRYQKAIEKDPNRTLDEKRRDLLGILPKYAPEDDEDDFTAKDLGAGACRSYTEQRSRDDLTSAACQLAKNVALADSSGGEYQVDTKWMQWAIGGEEAGVDEAEVILFKLAYEMSESEYNEDGKVIPGSKKENTLEQAMEWMPWLTEKEMDYLKSNYWSEKK